MNVKLTDTDKTLISLIFHNIADDAIEIMEGNMYNKYILSDIGLIDRPFPLYWLIKCNETILDDNNWIPDYLDKVILPARANCDKLLEYFKLKGFDSVGEVNYNLFPNERGHFVDWDFSSLFEADIHDLCKMGYDENECLLCYSVLTGNIVEIERQIKLGTNPDVWISGNRFPKQACKEDGESYNALCECDTFYCDCLDIYNLRNYLEDGVNKIYSNVNNRMLSDLIQASFYKKIQLMLLPLKKHK